MINVFDVKITTREVKHNQKKKNKNKKNQQWQSKQEHLSKKIISWSKWSKSWSKLLFVHSINSWLYFSSKDNNLQFGIKLHPRIRIPSVLLIKPDQWVSLIGHWWIPPFKWVIGQDLGIAHQGPEGKGEFSCTLHCSSWHAMNGKWIRNGDKKQSESITPRGDISTLLDP